MAEWWEVGDTTFDLGGQDYSWYDPGYGGDYNFDFPDFSFDFSVPDFNWDMPDFNVPDINFGPVPDFSFDPGMYDLGFDPILRPRPVQLRRGRSVRPPAGGPRPPDPQPRAGPVGRLRPVGRRGRLRPLARLQPQHHGRPVPRLARPEPELPGLRAGRPRPLLDAGEQCGWRLRSQLRVQRSGQYPCSRRLLQVPGGIRGPDGRSVPLLRPVPGRGTAASVDANGAQDSSGAGRRTPARRRRGADVLEQVVAVGHGRPSRRPAPRRPPPSLRPRPEAARADGPGAAAGRGRDHGHRGEDRLGEGGPPAESGSDG